MGFIASYLHNMRTSGQLCVRIGFLCLVSLLDGMVDSCIGPALRDLQCILNVTLQKVSLFLPTFSTGKMIGALLFLKIRGRFNTYGVAATTITVSSCLLSIVPVVPSFWISLGLLGAAGLADGTAVHAKVLLSGELSKEHAASIHIINLAMSAGDFTGPIVISFFLRETSHTESINSIGNTTLPSNSISAQSQGNICNFRSDVMYGFLVFGSVGVLVFTSYVLALPVFQEENATNENHPEEKSLASVSPRDALFLSLIVLYTAVCGPMIFVYGQYLPTFGFHSRLHQSTWHVTRMFLSFYAGIMIGRVLGTLISLIVSQTVLIYVCTVGGMAVSVMLACVSELDATWLWVGTSVLAVVCSPVFSGVQTWALEVNEHKNVLYGIASIGDMAGYSALSLVTGQLMAYFFVEALNYVLVFVSSLQLLLIILLYLTARKQDRSENIGYSSIK
ncbi:major facilitator superfamily domain-containing protein 4A-like [Haliotis asinina]|uniref:major facilitator superfamily domain-containing protein 4A-like n=1 Tax=Haliotis asinina TaxID=109174 RepID=UPI00353271B7